MYLPPQLPIRTLLVAHNADYNGTWHLGTPVRGSRLLLGPRRTRAGRASRGSTGPAAGSLIRLPSPRDHTGARGLGVLDAQHPAEHPHPHVRQRCAALCRHLAGLVLCHMRCAARGLKQAEPPCITPHPLPPPARPRSAGRRLCEHSGSFNMLSPLLRHMQTMQQGLGVVAVSPRYATRQGAALQRGCEAFWGQQRAPACLSPAGCRTYHCANEPIPSCRAGEKFSMFWALPPGRMTGILNGLEDDARPRLAGRPGSANGSAHGGAHDDGGEEGAVDLGTFFERKQQAKLGFQAAKGLQVRGAGGN